MLRRKAPYSPGPAIRPVKEASCVTGLGKPAARAPPPSRQWVGSRERTCERSDARMLLCERPAPGTRLDGPRRSCWGRRGVWSLSSPFWARRTFEAAALLSFLLHGKKKSPARFGYFILWTQKCEARVLFCLAVLVNVGRKAWGERA